jgi:hypothetical protein
LAFGAAATVIVRVANLMAALSAAAAATVAVRMSLPGFMVFGTVTVTVTVLCVAVTLPRKYEPLGVVAALGLVDRASFTLCAVVPLALTMTYRVTLSPGCAAAGTGVVETASTGTRGGGGLVVDGVGVGVVGVGFAELGGVDSGELDVGDVAGVVTGETVPGLGVGVPAAAGGAVATATIAAAPSPTKIG